MQIIRYGSVLFKCALICLSFKLVLVPTWMKSCLNAIVMGQGLIISTLMVCTCHRSFYLFCSKIKSDIISLYVSSSGFLENTKHTCPKV